MAIKEQDKVFYEEAENGDKIINLPVTRANNVEGLGRSINTTYSVGNVVYTDTNLSVALKCVTAGTTSSDELDISTASVGDTVEDGSVVWSVIARSNVLDENGTVAIANGGTGGNTFVKTASVSGKVITLELSDGTKETLITQDTEKPADMTDYIIESYRNGTEWYRIWESGWVEQGGTNDNTSNMTITFLKEFKTTEYTFSGQVYNKNNTHNYFDLNKPTKTTTSITFTNSNGQGIRVAGWYACGQGA